MAEEIELNLSKSEARLLCAAWAAAAVFVLTAVNPNGVDEKGLDGLSIKMNDVARQVANMIEKKPKKWQN